MNPEHRNNNDNLNHLRPSAVSNGDANDDDDDCCNTTSAIIVDTDDKSLGLMARGLEFVGFQVATAYTGTDALRKMSLEQFDVLLADIGLSDMSALDLMKEAVRTDPAVAILIVSAVEDVNLAVEYIEHGAYDYIVKPFDLADVTLRIRQAVRDRAAKQGLIRLQRDLERRSLESCQAIKSVFLSSLASLSSAHEAKSNHTKDHSLRVARISSALAERCNLCDQRFSETLRTASLLHDIGKIGVPDEILAKPGPLSDMEFHVIKTYPLISESILKPLSGDDPDLPSIVRHQHERWDGRGYPDGLKGEEIPMGARIIAVADAFDAMVCDRPYRSRLPSNRVIEILRDERGHQWDRRVVDALLDYAASGDSSDLGTRLVLARDASLSAVTLRSLRPAA